MNPGLPLPDGRIALVDDEDYARLSQYDWALVGSEDRSRGLYVVRYEDGRAVRLHREITDAPEGVLVDHRSGDTLDNRRENLRFASHLENSRNRRRRIDNKSGFKGVWKRDRYKSKPWFAAIVVDRRVIDLGSFETALGAAVAYDRASAVHHGEFSSPNFDPKRDWIFPQIVGGGA